MQETKETWVRSLSWEDPLEEGMATHSSIPAWRPSWTEEPAGYTVQRVVKSWTWLKWLNTEQHINEKGKTYLGKFSPNPSSHLGISCSSQSVFFYDEVFFFSDKNKSLHLLQIFLEVNRIEIIAICNKHFLPWLQQTNAKSLINSVWVTMLAFSSSGLLCVKDIKDKLLTFSLNKKG